jgi:hypothetical protein
MVEAAVFHFLPNLCFAQTVFSPNRADAYGEFHS